MTTSSATPPSKNVAIYSELLQLGSPGHEKLTFSPTDMVPATAKKPSFFGRVIDCFYKPINQRIQTVVANTLNFFEQNRDLSKPRSDCLQVLRPVVYKTKNKELIDRYTALVTEQNETEQPAYKAKKVQLDQEVENYRQELEQKKEEIQREKTAEIEQAIKQLEDGFQQSSKLLKNKYQDAITLLEGKKARIEKDIEELKEINEREKQDWDTTLKGKDGSVLAPWSLLERLKVKFITNETMQSQRKEFIKTHSTERFAVDLKDFSAQSLDILVHFLSTLSLPENLLSTEDLLELASLADFVSNPFLKTAVIEALSSKLTQEEAEEILKTSDSQIAPIKTAAEKALERANREINEQDRAFLIKQKEETVDFLFLSSNKQFEQEVNGKHFNVRIERTTENALKVMITHQPYYLMNLEKKQRLEDKGIYGVY